MQECIILPFSLSLFQSLSPVLFFSTPWTVAHQAPPSSTLSQHLLQFLPIQSVMPSNYLILRCPFLLSLLLLFSHYVVSDSLWPHGPQHARLPCPSLFPGACSKSRPLSQWCHLTISFFDVPFSSCPHFPPASGAFPVSQLFASGGQSIGASASVLSMNIQTWFPLGWTGLIPLWSKGLLSLLQHHSSKVSVLWCSAFLLV